MIVHTIRGSKLGEKIQLTDSRGTVTVVDLRELTKLSLECEVVGSAVVVKVSHEAAKQLGLEQQPLSLEPLETVLRRLEYVLTQHALSKMRRDVDSLGGTFDVNDRYELGYDDALRHVLTLITKYTRT